MPDPATYRPAPGSIPDEPGVYRFRDPHGRVIYVGKAKSLRARLSSYFQDIAALHPRTQTMVTTAASVEWTVVSTEVEALQLEYTWIKEYDPRFNVKYRDDKSYPSLAVTLNEEFPRVQVMRGPRKKGVRYFGPYAHAWAIRETVDLLLRVFPVRTCSGGVFRRATQVGRPCLLGYIDKCSAPCVGRVTPAEHRAIAEDFCVFMSGQTTTYLRRLEKEMREAAAVQEYERAARLRDDIRALDRAVERNAVVLGDGTDADVIALADDPLEAAFQVFHVRGGRVRGQRGWVTEKVEDIDAAGLVEQLLIQFYGTQAPLDGASAGGGGAAEATVADAVPREVLVPVLPQDTDTVVSWLSALRGARVDLRVPRRGDKASLMETVARNATQALALHKTRRASDLTTRSRALQEIADALGMDTAPLRIECYDVSNLQGTNVVASMVVFEDGLPRKAEYRRFAIRGIDGQDDTAAIHEVITRRFRRYLEESERSGEPGLSHEVADGDAADGTPPDVPVSDDQASDNDASDDRASDDRAADSPAPDGTEDLSPGEHPPSASTLRDDEGRPRRFAYPPQLVVVDGGPPQVAAAARALAELGIDDVALAGLAKRLEEVWLPGEPDPVVFPRTSEALYLLQRVRDEAHRFAITYHRQRRSKAMTSSALDGVPGLGETRRKALLARFGSLRKLSQASAEEIAEVPGIGPRTAAAVVAALAGRPTPAPAVNTATGEIVEPPELGAAGPEGGAPRLTKE